MHVLAHRPSRTAIILCFMRQRVVVNLLCFAAVYIDYIARTPRWLPWPAFALAAGSVLLCSVGAYSELVRDALGKNKMLARSRAE